MSRRSAHYSWSIAAVWTIACAGSKFSSSLSGNSDAGLSGGTTGTGLVAGTGGTGGTGSTASSSGGTASGGTASGGTANGGTAGSSTGAGGGQGDGAVTCSAPTTWYPDADQDQHGVPDGAVVSCDPPSNGSWATVNDDCNDNNAAVHPGVIDYFDAAYSTPNGISFDYDCSHAEEPAPNQVGAAPDCFPLSAASCGGEGFIDALGRTGIGVTALCGSHQYGWCSWDPNLALCVQQMQILADGYGYACH